MVWLAISDELVGSWKFFLMNTIVWKLKNYFKDKKSTIFFTSYHVIYWKKHYCNVKNIFTQRVKILVAIDVDIMMIMIPYFYEV